MRDAVDAAALLDAAAAGFAAQAEVAASLAAESDDVLAARPGPKAWSAVDCLEHVRRTNAVYGRHLARALERAARRGGSPAATFRPGRVGAWFTGAVGPLAEGSRAKRMRAPRGIDPASGDASPLPVRDTVERFREQLGRMGELVERARGVDLHARTNTLLGPLFRLRLGDAFRALVAHGDRHLDQARRAVASARGAT